MKYISKIIIMLIFLLTLGTTSVFARPELDLEITTSKEEIRVGDVITVTVDWQKEMQAADFALRYDGKILEYLESDIDKSFTKQENNKILVFWFSDDNTSKTKMEFKFKAIETGKVALRTQIEGGFATGELRKINECDEGNKTIEVLEGKITHNNSKIQIAIIGIVVFIAILFIIFFINKKKQRRNR